MMRPLAALLLLAAACEQRPTAATTVAGSATTAPAPAAPPAPSPTAPVAAAPSDRCDAAIRHVSGLLGETTGIDEEVARCRSEHWRPEFVACMVDVPDVDTYASRCMKLLFSDEDGLRVNRVFAYGAPREATPPAGEQDGDLTVYSSDGCGFLTRKRYPGEAVYLLCKDTVFAGPLTTPAEIEELSAQIMEQMREGHELRMRLMANYPKFRTVRVYDAVGNYQGTEVR